jgi:signal transduction histidine kinase
MKEGVDRTIRIMRHITSTLRPVALDLGLIAGLEWLVEEFTRHAAIHCQLKASGCEEVVLDDGRATALFRIVQESLTNIVKHAGATEVVVSIRIEDNQHVCIQITDNGKGFIPESARKAGSFGLIGMRERALMLHGEIHIDSTPGVGSRVEVCIPLAPQSIIG